MAKVLARSAPVLQAADRAEIEIREALWAAGKPQRDRETKAVVDYLERTFQVACSIARYQPYPEDAFGDARKTRGPMVKVCYDLLTKGQPDFDMSPRMMASFAAHCEDGVQRTDDISYSRRQAARWPEPLPGHELVDQGRKDDDDGNRQEDSEEDPGPQAQAQA